MTLFKIALISALLAPSFAKADNLADSKAELARIDSKQSACLASDEGNSNYGMGQCMGTAYVETDALLNKVYSRIVANLKGQNNPDAAEKLKRLRASEVAWIAYRDANSSLHGTLMLGGSGEGLTINSVRLAAATARVLELEDIFQDR